MPRHVPDVEKRQHREIGDEKTDHIPVRHQPNHDHRNQHRMFGDVDQRVEPEQPARLMDLRKQVGRIGQRQQQRRRQNRDCKRFPPRMHHTGNHQPRRNPKQRPEHAIDHQRPHHAICVLHDILDQYLAGIQQRRQRKHGHDREQQAKLTDRLKPLEPHKQQHDRIGRKARDECRHNRPGRILQEICPMIDQPPEAPAGSGNVGFAANLRPHRTRLLSLAN